MCDWLFMGVLMLKENILLILLTNCNIFIIWFHMSGYCCCLMLLLLWFVVNDSCVLVCMMTLCITFGWLIEIMFDHINISFVCFHFSSKKIYKWFVLVFGWLSFLFYFFIALLVSSSRLFCLLLYRSRRETTGLYVKCAQVKQKPIHSFMKPTLMKLILFVFVYICSFRMTSGKWSTIFGRFFFYFLCSILCLLLLLAWMQSNISKRKWIMWFVHSSVLLYIAQQWVIGITATAANRKHGMKQHNNTTREIKSVSFFSRQFSRSSFFFANDSFSPLKWFVFFSLFFNFSSLLFIALLLLRCCWVLVFWVSFWFVFATIALSKAHTRPLVHLLTAMLHMLITFI